MIKILVVEDQPVKVSHIARVLISSGIHESWVTQATNTHDAKRLLQNHKYDLLLLDLHLPNRIDGDATNNGGIELLRSISQRATFNLPYHVIGITAYEDAYNEGLPEFNRQIWCVLKYDPALKDWADQLKLKVEYLLKSKEQLRYSDGETFETDVAIITALEDPELKAILDLPGDWRQFQVPHDHAFYYKGKFTSDEKEFSVVASAAPRMGMPSSTALATKMIHNFRPRILCMTGIAAGIKEHVKMGDIIVADPSWDWGSGKFQVDAQGDSSFAPESIQIALDAALRENLNHMARDSVILEEIRKNWKGTPHKELVSGHVAAMASGGSVIGDKSVTQKVVNQHRKLFGIDMEVYGIYSAAQMCGAPKPMVFAVKGVCDYADVHKEDKLQSFAAYVSAQFAYRFILKYL